MSKPTDLKQRKRIPEQGNAAFPLSQ